MTVIWLAIIFFCTSAISVVTGGTSLLTVPVMIQFGIEPRDAVATNMFALVFLSAGGSLPFFETDFIPPFNRLLPLIILTIIGSVVRARFLLIVPSRALQPIIAVAMVAVAGFSLLNRRAGLATPAKSSSPTAQIGGFLATFLGMYGGFFSGGYVVLLTAAYIVCLRMTFMQGWPSRKFSTSFLLLSRRCSSR